MRLRNLFHNDKPATMDPVATHDGAPPAITSPPGTSRGADSQPLHSEQDQIARELSALERKWDQLVQRHDPVAFTEMNAIAPQVEQLRARRDHLVRLMAASAERTQLIAELVTHHDEVAAQRDRALTDLKARADVPEPEVLARLFVLGRAATELQQMLFSATGDRRFARAVNPTDALRFFWHSQHEERNRVMNRVLAPGSRPKLPPQPWDVALARLRVLDAKGEQR